MSRTIAIGDIHGCSKAFAALLDAVRPAPDDTVVTLGDCIDRGPDSRGVMEQMLTLGSQCRLVPILGNHELMLLWALQEKVSPFHWEMCGGRQTLESYGGQLTDIPAEHIEFIERFVPFHESERHLFFHANYIAEVPPDRQPERVLYWEHVTSTLPPPHRSGKTVVLGHTPQLDGEILDVGHLICLDTACFAGGWLTAMDVESHEIWQVDMAGHSRNGRLRR